ncbi:lipase family protein [Ruminococcus sp.]|uniref:lipase family protein n=1 Tax=Ruminococcus sp. TaxID=41978 RepID=UPI003862F419
MIIDSAKKEWLLRWPISDSPRQTALQRIPSDHGFPPGNSCFFSPTACSVAAALSMSADDEKLLRDNLSALGYGDILTVAYHNTERDKVGMCIASRIRENRLQIAVVLRGTSGDEWYSNFEVGYSAEHSGFAKAADFAELQLGDYVFTRAIGTQPEFFVTGYSRGGAVANILAKRLCDRYGLERVCAYTFAAPSTTLSRRTNRYNCIYNLVRQEDLFTRVPPEGWGYTKYGKNIPLSNAGEMTARYRQLTGEDYIGFTRQNAVDDFIGALYDLAPNVNAYYRRRRPVGDRKLSLYEFMTAVAHMLSQNMDDDAADIFLSAMMSDYADLLNFLSSGADLNDLITSVSAIPRCSVADSHSPAAYMASLDRVLG